VKRALIGGAAILIALTMAASPPAAHACSFSWKRGWSPDEIKQREDVRAVQGTWRMGALEGERFTDEEGQEWVRDGRFVGRIEEEHGVRWSTWHLAPDERTTCSAGTYFNPMADAKGTFWIARRKVDGRFEILLWEGEYLPQPQAAEAAP